MEPKKFMELLLWFKVPGLYLHYTRTNEYLHTVYATYYHNDIIVSSKAFDFSDFEMREMTFDLAIDMLENISDNMVYSL